MSGGKLGSFSQLCLDRLPARHTTATPHHAPARDPAVSSAYEPCTADGATAASHRRNSERGTCLTGDRFQWFLALQFTKSSVRVTPTVHAVVMPLEKLHLRTLCVGMQSKAKCCGSPSTPCARYVTCVHGNRSSRFGTPDPNRIHRYGLQSTELLGGFVPC